jgi:hypothetical protein
MSAIDQGTCNPPSKVLDVTLIQQLIAYAPDTGVLTWKKNRRRARVGDVCGTPNKGYIQIRTCGVTMRAHRIAWAIHFGEWPYGYVDHINGIRSDNRIENLRIATVSQNTFNRGVQKNNKHGIKGVTPVGNRWMAQIQVHGKQMYLGTFDVLEDASKAYKTAALGHFGEYANSRSAP